MSNENAVVRGKVSLTIENVSRYILKRSTLAFVCALGITAMLIGATPRSYGQVDTATLNGTVTDPTGAAVPGATITLTEKDTGVNRVVISNASGDYSAPSLSPGNYILTVMKPGFTVYKESGLTLQVAQVATVNVTLGVGSDTQTVNVAASTSFLDTNDASLGTVIPEQQITDLPLNGRQFSQLLQLSPGTVPIDVSQNAGKAPNYGGGGLSPAVDGQTNRSNLFILDGIIASNPFFGGFSFSPSVDAIQEFKAQSHTDQAEYGQATGAVVSVVSRSGTNTFHGAAYEFFRNNVLDARNYFDTVRTPYHLNQFGASFGGPILKDKLFFYANYEGGRQVIAASSANDSTVPTEAERAGNFSGLLPGNVTATIYDPTTYDPVTMTQQPFSGNMIPQGRIDTQMLAYLNGIYPHANQPANASGENNYAATTKNTTFGDQGSIRIDYTIGQKDSLNGRYSQNEATLASPSSLANLFETGFNGKNTGVTWVHTFNPSLLMEITGGYNNLNIPQAIYTPVNQTALFSDAGLSAGWNTNPGGTPVVLVPGYNLEGGNYTGYWNGAGPIGPMHIVQVGGNVSKTEGTHSLKFGASFYHTWMYTNWAGNNLDFSYKGTWNAACQFVTGTAPTPTCPTYVPTASNLGAGGDPVASMLLSAPIDATRYVGNDGVNLIENTPAIFAQDSWRISPRFTLNYGLRWDFSSPMTEKNNRLATYDFYNQTYSIVKGDVDLPSGPLPANTVVLNRHSIVTSHYGDFSPRLGFAFQASRRTTLRMGIGRTFDDWGLPLQVGQQNRGAWPSGIAQEARVNGSTVLNAAGISIKPDGTPATGQNPFYGEAVLGPSPLPAGGLGFQDIKWVPASSVQWNVEVAQDLGSIGVLSLAYVGSHTEHQTILQPFNTAPASTTPFSDTEVPDQIFGGVGSVLRSTGWANYNSFQTKLIRSFSNGLAYNAAFTWSNTGAFSNCGDFSSTCIQNIYNTGLDYGNAELDVPLVFTVAATYALPFGKGKQYLNDNSVAAAIFGNWQINTILATRSGTVINPTNGSNGDTANAGGGAQRVNINGDPNAGAPHKLSEWFNPTVFSLPANGSYGNSTINSLRGPGYVSDDLSLFRDIPLGERFTVQFRAESFDIFNHPNWGNPNGSFSGTSTDAGGNVSYKNGFNTITSTVATTGPGANRTLQFALKLLF